MTKKEVRYGIFMIFSTYLTCQLSSTVMISLCESKLEVGIFVLSRIHCNAIFPYLMGNMLRSPKISMTKNLIE